jgi:hypothetical protein
MDRKYFNGAKTLFFLTVYLTKAVCTHENLDVHTNLFFSFYSKKMQNKIIVNGNNIRNNIHGPTYIRGARAEIRFEYKISPPCGQN